MSENSISPNLIPSLIASDDFPMILLPAVLSAVSMRLATGSLDETEACQASTQKSVESLVLGAILAADAEGLSRRHLIHHCWGYRSLNNNDRGMLIQKLMDDHGVVEIARRSEETGRLSRVLVAGSCRSRNDEVMRNDDGCSHHFNASNDAASGEMLR